MKEGFNGRTFQFGRKVLEGEKSLEELLSFSESLKERKKVENPFRRSALIVSGDRIKHLKKALIRNADVVILNVEDGVSPERKEFARIFIRKFLTNTPLDGSKEVVIRINGIETTYFYEDLFQLLPTIPHGIRLSKVESSEDVVALDRIINAFERSRKIERGFIKIHLSIETGRAVESLNEILSASDRIEACYLGILDLFADLKLPQGFTKGSLGLYVKEKFVLTCRSFNVHPIAPAFQEYEDLKGFEEETLLEKEMGFSGKMCISVKQAEIANRVFSPSEEELRRAKEIVEVYEKALAEGKGGVAYKGLFIDQPIYRDALNTLKYSGSSRS